MTDYIGTATMDQDGTLTLDLHVQEPKTGDIGVGELVLKPDDWQYKDVLDHIGGLKPGESKAVPAWPDEVENTDDISDILSHEYDDLIPLLKNTP